MSILVKTTLSFKTYVGTKRSLETAVKDRTRDVMKSEEEWKRTFNSIPDLVSIHDRDFRILKVNKAFEDKFGMTSEQIVGKHCYEVFHGKNEPWPTCPHKRTLATKEPTIEDIDDKHLGGVFSIGTSPIFEDGEIIGSVHVCRDITDHVEKDLMLKDAFDKLTLAHDELKELDELKISVIDNVSHELRTPITVALGALELIEEEEEPEEKGKLIDMAKKSLLRQNMIIEDMLEAAKMEDAADINLRTDALDIKRAITLMVDEFIPLAKAEEINLETKISEDLPLAEADFKRLAHVLRNLISNAMKFTGVEGTITVEAAPDKNGVMISVSDTGIGIPVDEHKKIFNRFYQVDGSISRRFGGTGMGLAIVKAIIEAHGSEIEVESEEGKGTKFTFTLPLAK